MVDAQYNLTCQAVEETADNRCPLWNLLLFGLSCDNFYCFVPVMGWSGDLDESPVAAGGCAGAAWEAPGIAQLSPGLVRPAPGARSRRLGARYRRQSLLKIAWCQAQGIGVLSQVLNSRY